MGLRYPVSEVNGPMGHEARPRFPCALRGEEAGEAKDSYPATWTEGTIQVYTYLDHTMHKSLQVVQYNSSIVTCFVFVFVFAPHRCLDPVQRIQTLST